MAIYASIQGLGALGASLAPPEAKQVLPECVAAAKALLASGKPGVLPSQCYGDTVAGVACGQSCQDSLKNVAAGKSPRMVQRSGPRGDKTCLQNAMSTSPVVCKNGTPVAPGPKAPGAAMDAATAAASAGQDGEQGAGSGWTEDTNFQPGADEGSPWPMRIGIGLGVGALVAGALYMKYGRG